MILKNMFLLVLMLALLVGCGRPLAATPVPVPETDGPALAETVAALVETASAMPAPTSVSPTVAETASPEPNQTASAASPWVAFTGPDRNIWLVNSVTSEMRLITQDATAEEPGSGQNTVDYSNPRWSSDGLYLAFQRQTSQPVVEGVHFEYSLWVYNTETGQERTVLGNKATAGYDWQPGTHRLTFSLPLALDYFTGRGSVNAAVASGVWVIDADAPGEPVEVIKAENGRALVRPEWSPDGSRLGFEEVILMEGRGLFAYYDMAAGQYIALERQVGSYDWSPGSQTLVFDMLTYVPNGTERIRFLDLAGLSERALQPEVERGYAFSPVFSPDGQLVAYLVGQGEEYGNTAELVVQPAAGGEPRKLGVFEYLEGLAWSPDGASLVLSSGSYDRRQVVAVQVADGAIRVLAPGWQPAWQPDNQTEMPDGESS